MKISNAIRNVELVFMNFPDIASEETIESFEIAVEAMEKQDPMKPMRKGKNRYCPNCDQWLLWDDAIPNEGDNYCGICGQKLDWED